VEKHQQTRFVTQFLFCKHKAILQDHFELAGFFYLGKLKGMAVSFPNPDRSGYSLESCGGKKASPTRIFAAILYAV